MRSLEKEIKEILYGYIAQDSISNTVKEKKAEDYFLDFFAGQDYFKAHPEYFGAKAVKDDPCNRRTVWAMVKGEGDDAIVCIHHHDVVTVEDFKNLKDYAFSPDELYAKLAPLADSFSAEAREDYLSGGWLFGRGGCDMKGGGSIQMALLAEYAKDPHFKGNLIVLSVGDEENFSAGMRTGVELLRELQEKYHLNYRLMINSEPHQRKTQEDGVFSFGSIGKLMPYVYVRGFLAHAGKVFEGFNPANVMAEIVRRTEINMDFSDLVAGEAAPPPTWLYLRENKISYDVSMPLTINGCLSVLTLNSSPKKVMARLRGIAEDAFAEVIDDMNRNYLRFAKATNRPEEKLPWKVKVVDFGELVEEAKANYGEAFTKAYAEKLKDIKTALNKGEESLIMANFGLVDFVYNYINDLSPRVVMGLVPPYYPNVANVLTEQPEDIAGLYATLNAYTQERWQQHYEEENYYTGISDLSYANLLHADEIEASLKTSMPFFGDIYSLPIKDIEQISMPCVNIGPWGKDFHKLTERVYKEDLYRRTPEILDYAIKTILGK